MSGIIIGMKFSTLIFYIGLAIIGFWLLGLLFKLASWALHIALIVGLVLVILSLINQYFSNKRKR